MQRECPFWVTIFILKTWILAAILKKKVHPIKSKVQSDSIFFSDNEIFLEKFIYEQTGNVIVYKYYMVSGETGNVSPVQTMWYLFYYTSYIIYKLNGSILLEW